MITQAWKEIKKATLLLQEYLPPGGVARDGDGSFIRGAFFLFFPTTVYNTLGTTQKHYQDLGCISLIYMNGLNVERQMAPSRWVGEIHFRIIKRQWHVEAKAC